MELIAEILPHILHTAAVIAFAREICVCKMATCTAGYYNEADTRYNTLKLLSVMGSIATRCGFHPHFNHQIKYSIYKLILLTHPGIFQ